MTGTPDSARQEPPRVLRFEAVLTPHRSLPPLGFLALMAGVGLVGLAAGLAFFLAGAWPVVGFLGLDVVLIYAAFTASYRGAKAYEIVRLTERELVLVEVDPAGRARRRSLSAAWLRIELEERDGGALVAQSRGRSLVLGRFLNAVERADLAVALRRALTRPPMAAPGEPVRP